MKLFLVALGISFLATPMMALNQPNPDEVYIRNLNVLGTGCTYNDTVYDISPDRKAFTVVFSNYEAKVLAGESSRAKRKYCQITLDLHVPSGWQYTLFKAEYAGFADLDSFVQSTISTSYYFQGNIGRNGNFQKTIYGPYYDDYQISDQTDVNSNIWSPCGGTRALNIKTAINIQAYGGGKGIMNLDSADGEFIHRYGMSWRPCTP